MIGVISIQASYNKPAVTNSDTIDEWIGNSVTRCSSNVFGNQIILAIAIPLLWDCFQDLMDNSVPVDTIWREVAALFPPLQSDLPDGTNPIRAMWNWKAC